MTPEPLEDYDFDGLVRRLNRYSVVITLLAMPVAFVFHSLSAALSIATGAALSYINFVWMKRAVDFVVVEGAKGAAAGRRSLFGFVARYVLIALVLYATIRSSVLNVVFILAGLLVYVAALLIECVYEVCRVLIRDYRNGRA